MNQKSPSGNSTYQPADFISTQMTSPDAAAFLRAHTDHMLATWMQLTKKQGTPAQASADPAFLSNSLPLLLQNLADALENPQWHYGASRNDDIAREHGRQRQQTNIYTIGKMIDEYAMLRHVVCETMCSDHAWPFPIMARIHAFIDAAICTATREFSGLDKDRASQQLNDSNRSTVAAKAELHLTQQQRDAAESDRDESRDNVMALLEEKQIRERFVALLSHDLRSPLSSIVISAQRLERKPDDVALATSVAVRVIRAATRIDRMIQDLLDAGRLRAGQKMPLTSTACDLAKIAAEAHEEYIANHGSRIKLKAPEQATGVWDENAIRRVIDNLVGNAVKYGAHKTDITIEVTDLPQKVRLAVHNHGNPLTEQEIAVLFNPYVRTESAESGEQHGWGLGLTLVQGVAKAHGGEAGASSSADTGTTFWFELPKPTSSRTVQV